MTQSFNRYRAFVEGIHADTFDEFAGLINPLLKAKGIDPIGPKDLVYATMVRIEKALEELENEKQS